MQRSSAAPSASKRSPIRRRSIQKPSRPRFDCWPETSSMAHWCRRSHRERAMTHETSADTALKPESASPACVLVVDDTIENLRLLSNMLSEEGYEVRAVTTGPQALEAVERDPPDVILLDISMPEMDGYEVCRRLKARDRSKD